MAPIDRMSMLFIRWTDATRGDNMQPITVGRIVHCWPDKHRAPEEGQPYYLEGPDGKPVMVCAGIICGINGDHVAVHYYLPDGSNGFCELSAAPASGIERGKWWWPPRA